MLKLNRLTLYVTFFLFCQAFGQGKVEYLNKNSFDLQDSSYKFPQKKFKIMDLAPIMEVLKQKMLNYYY